MTPHNVQLDHQHHRFSNGATVLSAAWREGSHYVGRATVIRPAGTVVGRFLTATGTSLEDVHAQLVEQGRDAYKEV